MHETMLENGLDFILDAAKKLQIAENTSDEREEAHAIKYSLLHLLSGIELVMKARLYIENWAYIFADINKANKNRLNTGDMMTVECSKCMDRLENLCDLKFSKDDKDAFEDLRKMRNCIEHFKPTDSVEAIAATINRALTATLTFLCENNEEFESPSVIDIRNKEMKKISEDENRLLEEITQVVAELKIHHQDAVKMAEELADKQGLCLVEERLICPSCHEQLLVPNYKDNLCHCYLCGYEADGEKGARDYLYHVEGIEEYRIVKDGGRYPVYTCPECGSNAFINVGNKYECISCRMSYPNNEIDFCSECGEPYWKTDDDWGMCPSCLASKWEKIEKE